MRRRRRRGQLARGGSGFLARRPRLAPAAAARLRRHQDRGRLHAAARLRQRLRTRRRLQCRLRLHGRRRLHWRGRLGRRGSGCCGGGRFAGDLGRCPLSGSALARGGPGLGRAGRRRRPARARWGWGLHHFYQGSHLLREARHLLRELGVGPLRGGQQLRELHHLCLQPQQLRRGILLAQDIRLLWRSRLRRRAGDAGRAGCRASNGGGALPLPRPPKRCECPPHACVPAAWRLCVVSISMSVCWGPGWAANGTRTIDTLFPRRPLTVAPPRQLRSIKRR
jgi:hypothetical protein